MRRALGQRHRALLLLGVALIAAGLATLARSAHLLRRPEQITIDARYQVRGTDHRRTAGVVLVLIDDNTFSDFNNQGRPDQWPFPRSYHARVIDALHRAGAKVIALDLQSTERSYSVEDDNAYIEAIARAGNMVLSTIDVGPHGTTDVLGGDQVLREVDARAADTSQITDTDGVIRRMQYSFSGLETFPVVVTEAATGRPVPASLFGGATTPVPIDFAGPPGTVSSISYSRVFNGDFPRSMFEGKIVIVGTSSPSLQDLHQTPMSGGDDPMPGPEVLANETATVLRGVPLRDASNWVTLLLILLLALLVCVAGMRLETLGVSLAAIAVLLLWTLATQLAFNSGTLLDYSDPAFSLLLATGGTVLVSMWAESRERDRLRKLFAANSAAIVDDVLRPTGTRVLEPTAIIAGYRIDSALGRGGMGVVYRANQLALDRTVALKLIAAERAQDPVFRNRFELESRLAASIEHPNVIPVYEAGDDDGLLFISMRLVDGTDLGQLLAHDGALEPRRTTRLIGQLAGALDAAHVHGLVHRDVKPANVLLTVDAREHLYLTDFGVAKQVGAVDGVTATGNWVGTLDYLAPEQIRGEPVTASADIYALAGVLYQCLTGMVPFPRENDAAKLWAQVNATPPAPSSVRPQLGAAIDAVIARGLAKSAAARFKSAGELAHACAEALGSVTAAASDDERPPRPAHASSPTVISD